MTEDPLALEPQEEEEFQRQLAESRAIRAKLKRRWELTALFIGYATFGAKVIHAIIEYRSSNNKTVAANTTQTKAQQSAKSHDSSAKDKTSKTVPKYTTKSY